VTDTKEEAAWRAEFERFGEQSTRDSLHAGQFQEAKRQFAYRWLGAKAIERTQREERTFQYVRYTLVVAAIGVFVGIVSMIVTLFH
jgi:hypothetical protein